jgi:hypothetical protein
MCLPSTCHILFKHAHSQHSALPSFIPDSSAGHTCEQTTSHLLCPCPTYQSDEPAIGAGASTKKAPTSATAAPDNDPLNLLGIDDSLMASTPSASGLLNTLLAPPATGQQQPTNGSVAPPSSQAPSGTNSVNKPVAVQVCVMLLSFKAAMHVEH